MEDASIGAARDAADRHDQRLQPLAIADVSDDFGLFLLRQRIVLTPAGSQGDVISYDIGPERRETVEKTRTLCFIEFPPVADMHISSVEP